MSDNYTAFRKRRRTLVIVEGNHEGHKLFPLLFRCFPEMGISKEDILIYETNIYVLYDCIVKEYGQKWDDDDVDLPYVVSKADGRETLYKEDFINIIMVFDYERQDPSFSEEKIGRMQRYFADETDVGKLYLNYPMVEAYKDLRSLPDDSFADRTYTAAFSAGGEYKDFVHRNNCVEEFADFYSDLDGILLEQCGVADETDRAGCYEKLMILDSSDGLTDAVEEILTGTLPEERMQTAKNLVRAKIQEAGYTLAGKTYWSHMRSIFKEIIRHNICKANRIQNGTFQVAPDRYRECYENIDLQQILGIQNAASKDRENGFIWVLATCMFVIPEYNFNLLA